MCRDIIICGNTEGSDVVMVFNHAGNPKEGIISKESYFY